MFIEPSVRTAEVYAQRDTADGSPARLPLYVSRPDDEGSVERPVLILIQEAFGVNEHIRDVCRRYARQGYVVVSPDLYYRIGEWQTFSYSDFAGTAVARNEVTQERAIGDLAATIQYIEGMEGVDCRRLGVLGYCMGGRMTYIAASQFPERVKVAAVYYGGGLTQPQPPNFPTAPIEWTDRISAPLIGFFGGKDKGIPREAVEQVDEALTAAGVDHQIFFYPEADHGFFCDERPSFDARAAEDAWHRTLTLFADKLGPIPAVSWDE